MPVPAPAAPCVHSLHSTFALQHTSQNWRSRPRRSENLMMPSHASPLAGPAVGGRGASMGQPVRPGGGARGLPLAAWQQGRGRQGSGAGFVMDTSRAARRACEETRLQLPCMRCSHVLHPLATPRRAPAVDAYYAGSSSSLSIPNVRVPLLVIQARQRIGQGVWGGLPLGSEAAGAGARCSACPAPPYSAA